MRFSPYTFRSITRHIVSDSLFLVDMSVDPPSSAAGERSHSDSRSTTPTPLVWSFKSTIIFDSRPEGSRQLLICLIVSFLGRCLDIYQSCLSALSAAMCVIFSVQIFCPQYSKDSKHFLSPAWMTLGCTNLVQTGSVRGLENYRAESSLFLCCLICHAVLRNHVIFLCSAEEGYSSCWRFCSKQNIRCRPSWRETATIFWSGKSSSVFGK